MLPLGQRSSLAVVGRDDEAAVAYGRAADPIVRPLPSARLASECIVDAETKDHENWKLIGELSEALGGELGRVHTRGWCRELSLANLGLPAVMLPPEEEEEVETAVEAARVQQARKAPKKAPRSSSKRRRAASR